MSVHRVCCCNVTAAGAPMMVRGGWYHFIVLNDDGSVSVLIGELRQNKFQDTPQFSNCYDNGTQDVCLTDCMPIEAPVGHPLCVPDAVKNTRAGNTGKAVKDIAAGAYHCIVRHTDNTISCWGLNAMGQCNVPTSAITSTENKGSLIDASNTKLKKIVGLHAGYSTSAVTFNDGSVFCWGDPEVASVVNTWSDLMMSPPDNYPGQPNGRSSTDNYDASKPSYARPRYWAAYNSDAELVTWNVQSDPNGYFNNLNLNRHCSPMFDLGVETDPLNPMEFDHVLADTGFNSLPIASEYSYIQTGSTASGYFGAQYPFIDSLPNYQYPQQPEPLGQNCDILCITDPNSAVWQDFLGMKWRNSVFEGGRYVNNFSNPSQQYVNYARKSCCDLQIKKDYAIAIRRTGQIITTRNTRSVVGCPSNTHCRDCDADRLQTVTNGAMGNPNANCPPQNASTVGSVFCNQHAPCSTNPDDPFCGQDFTNCACCTNATPSIYLGCPNCSSQQCAADRRYIIDGTTGAFYEGIGCMSAEPQLEAFYHNPNWADATSGSLSSRWTSGLQVLYGHGSNRPAANTASVQQNYGWTTMPATDGVNNPRSAGQDFACQNFHYPALDLSCAKLCKSSGSWQESQITPDGTPIWNYPEQMFSQAVQAGTNTVMWTQLGTAPTEAQMPPTGGDSNDPDVPSCSGCGQLAKICRDSQFWYKAMPNTGELTTGCIYTGVNKVGNPAPNFKDKYNCENPHRYAFIPDQVSMATTINYNQASKPWGPYSIALWQGASRDNLGGYPNCHCCEPPAGQQIRPPGVAEVISNEWPVSGFLDPVLGSYFGMPFEANLHCRGSVGDTYTWCSAKCEWLFKDGNSWSNYSAPFCANYPVRSVASTRMAFAMVQADHRAYDANGPMTPPGDCGKYPTGSAPEDPSQWLSCTQQGHIDTSRQNEMTLHVWGSLWDPCSPFPRVCDCTMTLPIDTGNEACTSPYAGESWALDVDLAYASPCDSSGGGTHPEGPAGTEAGTGIPVYPSWTRTPTTTARSARKGSWSGSTWVQQTPAVNEPTVSPTRYCPNCDSYQQQFYRNFGSPT